MFPKRNQYYAVICANLMTFNYGITVGWPSATLPLLQSEDTPLPSGPLTMFQVSSIASIICIGAILGQLLFGWISNKYGRKPAMLLVFIPAFIHWLLLEFGLNFYALLTARFLVGVAAGGVFQVIPLIVSEISIISERGRLGALLMLFTNAGTVFAYIICNYFSYFTVPWISITICLIFLVGYWNIPETPTYLMIMGNGEKLAKSIDFFHHERTIQLSENKNSSDIENSDIDVGIQQSTPLNKQSSLFKLDIPATRALILGNVLVSITVFSGLFTFANYYQTIFNEAGSSLTPAISSIIVGSIQLAGTISASLIVDKIGRKPLILVSAYGSAIFVFIMGFHASLKDLEYDLSSFSWVPLVCLSLLAFVAANGAQSVPYIVLSEIFAQEVRGLLISVCLIGNWLLSFMLILIFPYMVEYVKMYGALWIFAGIECLLASIVVKMMPETKGVSIEEIVQILGK